MEIVTLAARMDLAPKLWDLQSVWPEFMRHDPVADLYYEDIESRWSDWTLIAIDGDHVAARGFCVTFAMGADIERPVLPSDGWDSVIRWSCLDRLKGHEPTAVSALEITIDPVYRGTGLAADMVRAMRDNASRHGFGSLVVPVRPSRKHLEPDTPMHKYADRVRTDGLPEDPWLRVHVRLGAEFVRICPTSMTIPGTLAQWRGWTGLPFDTSGSVVVPDALVPVHVDVEQNHAVYIEPNVWLRHHW